MDPKLVIREDNFNLEAIRLLKRKIEADVSAWKNKNSESEPHPRFFLKRYVEKHPVLNRHLVLQSLTMDQFWLNAEEMVKNLRINGTASDLNPIHTEFLELALPRPFHDQLVNLHNIAEIIAPLYSGSSRPQTDEEWVMLQKEGKEKTVKLLREMLL